MFDAIAHSNWWGDATAALQLLAHLEGDALTEHYGSLGRLADYRPQFEKMSRKKGENPSIFAIALETLAVKPVCHRRLLSGISLSVVECGTAMPTLRLGDLASRGQRWL